VTTWEHHVPLAFHSRREADHSPPSSAEVENAWSYTSTPQYVFMVWCSFHLYFYLYHNITRPHI